MADLAWICERAPEFLRHLIDAELIGLDFIHEEMEYHYGEPFSRDDAQAMRDAMAELGED